MNTGSSVRRSSLLTSEEVSVFGTTNWLTKCNIYAFPLNMMAYQKHLMYANNLQIKKTIYIYIYIKAGACYAHVKPY